MSKYRVKIWLESSASFLLEGGKGAAAGFLDLLVGIQDHAEEL